MMRPHIVVAGLGLALGLLCPPTLTAVPLALAAGPAVRVGVGGNPQAAVFADGSFVVVWNSSAPSGAGTLHARLFDRAGTPKTGDIQLLQPAGQVLDSVAALPVGFAAVWEQSNAQGVKSVLGRSFNRRGVPLTAPFKVHADSSYDRCCALVAAGPGTGFTIDWTSFIGGIHDPGNTSVVDTRSFDSSGRALGSEPADPPLDNSTPFPFELDESFPIGLTVDPGGQTAAVVLGQADEGSITLERGGTSTLLEPEADFKGHFDPIASFQPGGGFTVAWSTNEPGFIFPPSLGSSILVRRFRADGTALGGGPVQANRRSGVEAFPRLATFPDGSYFVLWAEVDDAAPPKGSQLYARSFDASDVPTSRERPIGSSAATLQVQPALVARPGGDAVAVWTEQGAGSSTVFFRLLSAPEH